MAPLRIRTHSAAARRVRFASKNRGLLIDGHANCIKQAQMPVIGQIMDAKILAALFPPTKRRIFCALFADVERWWTLAELAARTGLRRETLDQQVTCLRNGGIVRARTIAGHILVQPDPASRVYGELQSIVNKLATAAASGKATEMILVVEDQAATARITRILLESWGYRVLEANSGAKALEIFEKHGNAIALLLTDVIMPEMSGLQLAQILRGRKPGLRVVFMSGSSEDEVEQWGATFLAKPFTPATLARMVRAELDRLGSEGERARDESSFRLIRN
jgi:CheY-like chemotaxis protein